MKALLACALVAILCAGLLPTTARAGEAKRASEARRSAEGRRVSEEEQEADKYYRTGDTTPPVRDVLAIRTDARAFDGVRVEPAFDAVHPQAERDALIAERMRVSEDRYARLADADLDAFVKGFVRAQADVIATQAVPDLSAWYAQTTDARGADRLQAEFFAYRQALECAGPGTPTAVDAQVLFLDAVTDGKVTRVTYYVIIHYTRADGTTGGFRQGDVLYVERTEGTAGERDGAGADGAGADGGTGAVGGTGAGTQGNAGAGAYQRAGADGGTGVGAYKSAGAYGGTGAGTLGSVGAGAYGSAGMGAYGNAGAYVGVGVHVGVAATSGVGAYAGAVATSGADSDGSTYRAIRFACDTWTFAGARGAVAKWIADRGLRGAEADKARFFLRERMACEEAYERALTMQPASDQAAIWGCRPVEVSRGF